MDTSKPIYRDERTRDSRRDWIRKNCPNGQSGYTFEDLDGVPRIYKPPDAYGQFMLLEFKWNGATVGYGQRLTFELIHKMLRFCDRSHEHYLGFYVINWPALASAEACPTCHRPFPLEIDFSKRPRINGVEVGWDDLLSFLLFRKKLSSLYDSGWRFGESEL